jgi:hypothetical protein
MEAETVMAAIAITHKNNIRRNFFKKKSTYSSAKVCRLGIKTKHIDEKLNYKSIFTKNKTQLSGHEMP